MEDHTAVWRWWQEGLEEFGPCFAEPGFRRFAEWVTGLVLDMEEHTVTQALTGLGRERDWTALERFVEYGRWEREAIERTTWRTIAETHPELWHDYRVTAVDDTKMHRTSEHVCGVCTFHEPAARCPNRAETVRAHNWVVIGALIPGRPWQCLPVAGRLYFCQSQVPPGERFVKRATQAVTLLEDAAQTLHTDVLGVVDGAYGVATVVRPLRDRAPEQPRVDVVTRLRGNARLYEKPAAREPGQMGCRPDADRRGLGLRAEAEGRMAGAPESVAAAVGPPQAHAHGSGRAVPVAEGVGRFRTVCPSGGNVHKSRPQEDPQDSTALSPHAQAPKSVMEDVETTAYRMAAVTAGTGCSCSWMRPSQSAVLPGAGLEGRPV
jgi:hypothetical protein